MSTEIVFDVHDTSGKNLKLTKISDKFRAAAVTGSFLRPRSYFFGSHRPLQQRPDCLLDAMDEILRRTGQLRLLR